MFLYINIEFSKLLGIRNIQNGITSHLTNVRKLRTISGIEGRGDEKKKPSYM